MRKTKNVMKSYTPIEVKVRKATSVDAWLPPTSLLQELADASENVDDFVHIMEMIWKRMNDNGKYWRHVLKALYVLDYLLKNGHPRVLIAAKENIHAVETLKLFTFVDEDGDDRGQSIREKSKKIVALIRDPDQLESERETARNTRARMSGVAFTSSDGRSLPKTRPAATSDGRSVEDQMAKALALSSREQYAEHDREQDFSAPSTPTREPEPQSFSDIPPSEAQDLELARALSASLQTERVDDERRYQQRRAVANNEAIFSTVPQTQTANAGFGGSADPFAVAPNDPFASPAAAPDPFVPSSQQSRAAASPNGQLASIVRNAPGIDPFASIGARGGQQETSYSTVQRSTPATPPVTDLFASPSPQPSAASPFSTPTPAPADPFANTTPSDPFGAPAKQDLFGVPSQPAPAATAPSLMQRQGQPFVEQRAQARASPAKESPSNRPPSITRLTDLDLLTPAPVVAEPQGPTSSPLNPFALPMDDAQSSIMEPTPAQPMRSGANIFEKKQNGRPSMGELLNFAPQSQQQTSTPPSMAFQSMNLNSPNQPSSLGQQPLKPHALGGQPQMSAFGNTMQPVQQQNGAFGNPQQNGGPFGSSLGQVPAATAGSASYNPFS